MLPTLVVAVAMHAPMLPPEKQVLVVAEARKAKGMPYVLGGRLRDAHDGLDCQGLVFFALQPVTTCGWRSWSVMPTTSVKGELGLPVAGASPVATRDLAAVLPHLQPGDVIWFVDAIENSAEPSIATLDGAPVWVWHTGMYVGDGRFVVGDHFAGAVVEEELVPYANAHYAGVFVTRMAEGPEAARCRRHAPMKLPPR